VREPLGCQIVALNINTEWPPHRPDLIPCDFLYGLSGQSTDKTILSTKSMIYVSRDVCRFNLSYNTMLNLLCIQRIKGKSSFIKLHPWKLEQERLSFDQVSLLTFLKPVTHALTAPRMLLPNHGFYQHQCKSLLHHSKPLLLTSSSWMVTIISLYLTVYQDALTFSNANQNHQHRDLSDLKISCLINCFSPLNCPVIVDRNLQPIVHNHSRSEVSEVTSTI